MRFLAELAPVVMLFLTLFAVVPKWWRRRVRRLEREREDNNTA